MPIWLDEEVHSLRADEQGINILIVEDGKQYARNLASKLGNFGKAKFVSTLSEGLKLNEEKHHDVIFVDLDLNGESGLDLIKEINARKFSTGERIIVSVLTNNKNGDVFKEATKLGADFYFEKSENLEELNGELVQLLRRTSFSKRLEYDFTARYCTQDKRLIRNLKEAGETAFNREIPIRFSGDSGTGKTFIGKQLAYDLDGPSTPFININMQELSKGLKESELKGTVKGMFTGSVGSTKGLFEKANGGTFFMDEIQDMPWEIQGMIRKPIDERIITPIGGEPICLDIRVMSAHNIPLDGLIEKKQFRHDLFYRLDGVVIDIPPLRERIDDIPLYINRFLRDWNNNPKNGKRVMSETAIEAFCDYQWPGNVRSLSKAFTIIATKAKIEITGDEVKSYLSEKSRKSKRTSEIIEKEFEKELKNLKYQEFMKEQERRIWKWCEKNCWDVKNNKVKESLVMRELGIGQSVFRRLNKSYGNETNYYE